MKIEKVLEKFLACKGVLKIQTCSGKIKKIEKSKMMESEYEIRTDLPSARARRVESDKRDLSPALITTARLILENCTRTSLRPYTTSSSNFFSLILWS